MDKTNKERQQRHRTRQKAKRLTEIYQPGYLEEKPGILEMGFPAARKRAARIAVTYWKFEINSRELGLTRRNPVDVSGLVPCFVDSLRGVAENELNNPEPVGVSESERAVMVFGK